MSISRKSRSPPPKKAHFVQNSDRLCVNKTDPFSRVWFSKVIRNKNTQSSCMQGATSTPQWKSRRGSSRVSAAVYASKPCGRRHPCRTPMETSLDPPLLGSTYWYLLKSHPALDLPVGPGYVVCYELNHVQPTGRQPMQLCKFSSISISLQ